ncbi:hypothetical protein [Sulfuriroseicoccus oceanibius]|uniref:Uncharacterized protein n=1 Tax=Sulfuriroseicoccus oceanibius TaxID=2707525 RepID=A0A6B3L0M3_9BACT|nr:hypothetical protein [Sulfuriroseicoccus oceanibius]QQL44382.1 hypothetical protein G3M56_010870 [Sulfuriroseicoccus oceanibius]
MATLRPYPPIQEKKSQKKIKVRSGGALGNFVILGMLVITAMLGYAAYLMMQPEDLADVEGYVSGEVPAGEVTNLMYRLENAGGVEQVITESELNAYVARRVDFEQTGALADAAEFNGVAVRLKPGLMEVIFDRTIRGMQRTVAVHVSVDFEGDNRKIGYQAVRFGQLELPAGRGTVGLVKPALDSLVNAMSSELGMIERIDDIRVEDGQLVLVPQTL